MFIPWREAAVERLERRKRAGEEQWKEIEAQQPGSVVGETLRGAGRGVAEAVGETAKAAGRSVLRAREIGMAGVEAAGAGLREEGERYQREGFKVAAPIGKAIEAMGRGIEDVGQKGQLAKYGIDPMREGPLKRGEAFPEDFWEGMRTQPLATLGLYGLENVGTLGATIAGTVAAGPAGGLGAGYLMESGAAYDEALREGAPKEQARQAAGMTGVVNMALEYLPAGKALRRVFKGAPAPLLRKVVEQALVEGGTESMQELNSILAASVTYAEDHEWGVEDLKQALASGLIGTVIGGATGTVVETAGRRTRTQQEPQEVSDGQVRSSEQRQEVQREAEDQPGRRPRTVQRGAEDAQPDQERGVQARRQEAGREVLEREPAEGEVLFVEEDGGAMEHAGSAVSPEAISRQAGGTKFYRVSPGGEVTPLLGPEAVDVGVRPSEVKVRVSPNGEAVIEQGTANPRQQEALEQLRQPPPVEAAPPEGEQRLPPQVQRGAAESGYIGAKPGRPGFEFQDPELEAGFQRGKEGVPQPSLVERVKTAATELGHALTREYHALPRGERFSRARESFRKIETHPQFAAEDISGRLQSSLSNLTPEQYDLFQRATLLDDLEAVVGEYPEGTEMPFGFTPETVAQEKPRVEAAVAQDPYVQEAVREVRKVWDETRQGYRAALESIGMPTDFLDKRGEAYLHHQVIEYAAMEAGGRATRLKTPKGRGFQRTLRGSEQDINLQYGAAQGQVLTQMVIDTNIAQEIRRLIDNYDAMPEAKAAAKATEGTDWTDHIPEGYVPYQFEKGNYFYLGQSLTDRVATRLLEKGLAEVGIEDLQPRLMVGGKRPTYLFPEELVRTLEEQGNRIDNHFMQRLQRNNRKLMRGWKKLMLLMPRRIVKYSLRNLFGGDIQKMIQGRPQALRKWKQAAGELAGAVYGKEPASGELRSWMAIGGWSSGLFQQELSATEASRAKQLKMATELHGMLDQVKSAKDLPAKYFAWAGKNVSYLEAISRYATYLSYLEDIRSSPEGRPSDFGASREKEIMALETPEDRAYWLSNQLIGAYDQISVMGQFLREHLVPFWSFQELNVKSNYGLIRNALSTPEAAQKLGRRVLGAQVAKLPYTAYRAGKLAGLLLVFEAAMHGWNRTMFPDEEEDLPEEVRRTPHIVFGRDEDGNVLYFNRLSVFAEAREWFGIDEFGYNVQDYLDGRISKEQFIRMVTGEPLWKAINMIGPTAGFGTKFVMDVATKKTTFPEPRDIYDIPDYLAKSVGLEEEFRYVTQRPSPTRTYPRSWRNAFVYASEPGAAAYYDTLRASRRFLESVGEGKDFSFNSPRTEALRNYKRAVRYQQPDVAEKYIRLYAEAGGTPKGFRESLRRMHPLQSVPKKLRSEFEKWLTPDEQDKLKVAIAYYEEVFGPDSAGTEEALDFLRSYEKESR